MLILCSALHRQDTATVFQTGIRISRCAVGTCSYLLAPHATHDINAKSCAAFLAKQNGYRAYKSSLIFKKCLEHKLWEIGNGRTQKSSTSWRPRCPNVHSFPFSVPAAAWYRPRHGEVHPLLIAPPIYRHLSRLLTSQAIRGFGHEQPRPPRAAIRYAAGTSARQVILHDGRLTVLVSLEVARSDIHLSTAGPLPLASA
jgi:hypothetical protein